MTAVPAKPPSIYAAISAGRLDPRVANITPRVYVPNNHSNTVDVIDPTTFRVIRTIDVGIAPQHVTPSWNLRHLYVGNTYSNTLTVIDPRDGQKTRTISIPDPYNLYFTPDGSLAIDVAERLGTLFFFDPRTWRPRGSVHDPVVWRGSPRFLAFRALPDPQHRVRRRGREGGRRWAAGRWIGARGGSPVDVKIAPDGTVFYVTNQVRGGVSLVDPQRMREIRFIPTGSGAHGFCVSRDGKDLYVSNRLAGTISVIRFATRSVTETWRVGGSPDMLQVSANGRLLWVSDRYDATVTVISTRTGQVVHTIPVGIDPHGLTLFPQPGRFSIGHNGVYR